MAAWIATGRWFSRLQSAGRPLAGGLVLGLLVTSGCAQPMWSGAKPPAATAAAAETGPKTGFGGWLLGKSGKADATLPKNPLALARLSESRGQTEQAERIYQEVIKQSPSDATAFHRLAVLYAKQGRSKEADEHFTRALALKPDDAELLSDAGYFYYLASRFDEAERCLRRALERSPGNRTYSNNLALVLGEQGRIDECITHFRRATASEHDAQANLAFVHAQRGDYRRAMELYDRALTADNSKRVAADAMIELAKYTPAPSAARPPAGAAPACPPSPGDNRLAAQQAAPSASSLAEISPGRVYPPAMPPAIVPNPQLPPAVAALPPAASVAGLPPTSDAASGASALEPGTYSPLPYSQAARSTVGPISPSGPPAAAAASYNEIPASPGFTPLSRTASAAYWSQSSGAAAPAQYKGVPSAASYAPVPQAAPATYWSQGAPTQPTSAAMIAPPR